MVALEIMATGSADIQQACVHADSISLQDTSSLSSSGCSSSASSSAGFAEVCTCRSTGTVYCFVPPSKDLTCMA